MKDDNIGNDIENHSEYKKIDEFVSTIFDDESSNEYLPPDERKILFSKQIQDLKKQKKWIKKLKKDMAHVKISRYVMFFLTTLVMTKKIL